MINWASTTPMTSPPTSPPTRFGFFEDPASSAAAALPDVNDDSSSDGGMDGMDGGIVGGGMTDDNFSELTDHVPLVVPLEHFLIDPYVIYCCCCCCWLALCLTTYIIPRHAMPRHFMSATGTAFNGIAL